MDENRSLMGLEDIPISDIIQCLGAMQQEERLKSMSTFLADKSPPAHIVLAVNQAVDDNRFWLNEPLRKKLEDLGVSASKDFVTFEA